MSAGGEQAGEKTHAPTPKRLEDAAKNGDILRSKEMGTAGVMLIGAAWLSFAGPWIIDNVSLVMRSSFSFDAADLEAFSPGETLRNALFLILPLVASVAVPVLLITLLTQLGPSKDGRWVTANLAFKAKRINPGAGIKRIFGPNGLIEMGKGLLKVGLLGAIAWFWGGSWLPRLIDMGRGNLHQQLTTGWDALTSLLYALAGGLVLIALIDLPVMWVRRNNRLKMTLQELRDENKESDGWPEMRAARRQRQREIAAASVSGAMRQAQFVITNPTHFAVAMVYDPDRAAAPFVVAKGRGEKAAAMKELAREYGVPMLESPALARSVYYTTRENQTVQEELYTAIASVLAFVLSLKRGEAPPQPHITVPEALRFDADGLLETSKPAV